MRVGSMFVINASDYDTIQGAVDAAQELPQAESGINPSGVVVLVPGGNYDENVIIRKNVSLIALGGFTTTITGLYLLPSSAEVCPQNLTVAGIWFPGTITIKNQTSNDSGVFNPDMGKWSLSFQDCSYSSIVAENICNIDIRQSNGFGAQSFLNCPYVAMYNSYMTEGSTTFEGNSSLSNQCSNLDNEEYALNTYNSSFDDLNVTTSGGTFPAVHRPNSSNKLVELRTITNSNDPGLFGEIAADSNYVYICIAANTWVRASLSTW